MVEWRERLVRFVLMFYGVGLFYKAMFYPAITLLVLAWIMSGGLSRFGQLLQEPLVKAILILCVCLLAGTLWSDAPLEGRHKWIKYLLLLSYLPFFGLLCERGRRVCWALEGLLAGMGLVLVFGIYQWMVDRTLGIPVLELSYLAFSAIQGAAAIFSAYFACVCRNRTMRGLLLIVTLALLFLQFQQGARGFLLATLLSLSILVCRYFWSNLRKFSGLMLLLVILAGCFTYFSPVMQDRWVQMQLDFAKIQQDDYNSSIGYRLAMWDVGLYGISQRPWWGHGTGAPERYFNQTIRHYKKGIYQNLPDFQPYSHFHNDWIEIGMHLGLVGIFALLYLLWAWYETWKRAGLMTLGITLTSFIILSGLTDTFMLFNRMPVMLLAVTAVIVCWHKDSNPCERANAYG